MSLHSNCKLQIPEIRAIVVNVGTMREKEPVGYTHRFVGSFAIWSSYYLWNCLLPVTSERVKLLSCSYHPLATSLQSTTGSAWVNFFTLHSLNSFSAEKTMENKYFLGLQSCYSEFLGPCSCGKSGPGLPRDQVGARHSFWISAKGSARVPLNSV